MVFIDWLAMYQAHPHGTLGLVGSEFLVSTDIRTGEIVKERVTGYAFKGSYDSCLLVRCDGSTISVSGNPSAFCRPDNLFGYTCLQDCVDVYNIVLRSLGLPQFEQRTDYNGAKSSTLYFGAIAGHAPSRSGIIGQFTSHEGAQSQYYETMLSDGRPHITRIDLTENIHTDDAHQYLRQLSGYVHYGRAGYLYPNGCTVEWGGKHHATQKGSRRVYHKYYSKAEDIKKKIDKLKNQNKHNPFFNLDNPQLLYLEKIYKHCIENGIIRNEVSLKSTELIDRGLQYVDNWKGNVLDEKDYYGPMVDTMTNVIYPKQFHKRIKLEETRLEGIKDALIERGVKESIARMAEMYHRAWIQGEDMKVYCGSKTTYYRYRGILLEFGIDIAVKCDISRITLRASRCSYHDAVVPDWYEMPNIQKVA